MFTESLFAFVLEQFAEEIDALDIPQPKPLEADGWITRSIMQKAIRRGMTDLALRAASTLVTTDRRTLWRRLLVTALEDLGIGEIDLLARIVAAYRDRSWRAQVGGEWRVVSALIAQACAGTRDQTANDLWNIARNDPGLDDFKSGLCDANVDDLLYIMCADHQPVVHRGVAVLIALGEDAGSAAPTHIRADPGAIFAAFADAGRYGHVAATYEQAYRQSRLALAPLSLCLWSESRDAELSGHDDDVPPATWAGDIPTFALDQYTRGGGASIRRYVGQSDEWKTFASRWGIEHANWTKAAGELLFRAEGAVVTNRRTWPLGQSIYDRSRTVGCFMPVQAVTEGLALIRRQLPLMDSLRLGYTPTNPTLTSGS